MNIQAQCCGLIVMAFLLYFYLRQKRVGLYSEKIFLYVLILTMSCVTLDILSIVAIYYRTYIPRNLLDLICKTYLVTICWVAFGALAYVLTDLYSEYTYKKMIVKYVAIAVVASVLIEGTPIQYHAQDNQVFTYGVSVNMTYAFALFFVLLGIFKMLRHGAQMNPRRRNAVMVWLAAWMLASIIQFCNNALLLVGFGMSLGMLILFISLENPETNMDRQVGCYNSHILLNYMNQCYDRQEKFKLILVSFAQYQQNNDKRELLMSALMSIASFYDTSQEIRVFKRVEPELVIMLPESAQPEREINDIICLLKEENSDSTEKLPDPVFCVMEDSGVAHNAEEVFHLLNYFRQNYKNYDHWLIHIDKDAVEESYMTERIKKKIVEALDEDRVEAFYQPIYGFKRCGFVSAEALARIRNEDGTLMSPAEFIPVAEETGLIIPLGKRVFEKACQMIQKGYMEQYGLSYIEVNLSVIQCEQKDLAESYIGIIHKYGISPHYINLEITETASIQIKQNLLENMKKLMSYGVTFSLDDFGNGQSNLDYVIDMPVSILKMDQNMTKAYFEKKRAQIVVEATLQMVHDMNLHMVSEGVETKEQLESMEKAGVDYIQGFYFSRPLPETEFISFLDNYQNG